MVAKQLESARLHKGLATGLGLRGSVSAKESRKAITTTGSMRWASLHHHTTFSYLDGFGLPEDHVDRAAELGMSYLALTEHGNVSSHVRLESRCEETGVTPIFGCELYCAPEERQLKNHLTVLAETQDGYQNLLRLVSAAWAEGFYYEPTVNGQMLDRHKDGLVVLSGCTGSLLATSLIGGKGIDKKDASYERAKKVARGFKRMLGDAFYLEVQMFPGLASTRVINPVYERLSEELDIPLAATADIHYTHAEYNEMQKILHHVRGGGRQTLEQIAASFEYDIKLSYPATDRDVYRALRGTGLSKQAAINAILNTEEIGQRCAGVKLPRMDMLRYPLARGQTTDGLYRQWLNDGWRYRGFHRLPKGERKRYIERVNYENSIIIDKDYVDYFLIVSDLVRFAKDSGIPVGPARGSVAASLVSYLLRITEVNPMIFPNLVFERFIDTTREDPPDIDLDFDDDRRMELWEYAAAKYGKERVGSIGSFTGYKSKVALDDIARAHNIPQWEVDKVKELLIERSSGDLRASATIQDTVEMFEAAKEVFDRYPALYKAMDLEGNYKGMGVHAAGLVISPRPITDVCAIYTREVAGQLRSAIAYDKYDAEAMGLLKIDALGLKTMGLIRIALEHAGLSLYDLYSLSVDDEETIQGFRENDIDGIFQFDGRAMREINEALQPDNFQEICDVNALARPGPLHNGASSEYIDIKSGRKKPEVLHHLLERITSPTNYQVVYQEQILRIVMEIGGFDWTSAAYIRKIISRKLGDAEFNKQGGKFMKGAEERGVPKEVARQIWGLCTTAGSYAFNAAHCTGYGLLAYWCMWLKRHYPQAFFIGALAKLGDTKKSKETELVSRMGQLIRDAERHGVSVRKPDPMLSQSTWTAGPDGSVLAGLSQIKGIGEKTSKAMLEFRRENGGVGSWDDYIAVPGIGPKTIETIKTFCAEEDPFKAYALTDMLNDLRKELLEGIEVNGRLLPSTTHRAIEVPYERGSDMEVVWVGIMLARNLRDLFEVNMARTGEPLKEDEVKDPHLREWVNALCSDETEQMSVSFDRWVYPRFRKAIWGITLGHDIVLVRGVKKGYQAARRIYARELWVIEP